MMLLICGAIPLLALVGTLGKDSQRRSLATFLIAAGVSFLAALYLIASAEVNYAATFLAGYGLSDASSRLFLLLICAVFLGTALYVYSRALVSPVVVKDLHRFVRFALIFFSAAVFSILSNHFLVTWIFLEVTTLAAAPLIYHQKGAAAFRAAWRYLLFSTFSLSLALIGFLCLAKGMELTGSESLFFVSSLVEHVPNIAPLWQPLGIALVIFGFCAKLGLAPVYAWLPETYDAAPPSVTTLLAAIQFNCVILALFRFLQTFRHLEPELVRQLLLTFGLASILIASLNIVVAKNYKRLIAYASINHAGVIAVGLGLGKSAAFGVVLYVLSNALVKAVLFLTSGNIKARFHTKEMADLHGLIKAMPYSGWFFMVGVFALLGFAPFGSFFGEVIIMSSMIEQQNYVVFTLFCILLTVIFVATGRSIFPMIWGEPTPVRSQSEETAESVYTLLPNLFFIVLLVVLGIYIPSAANSILQEVARTIGGAS